MPLQKTSQSKVWTVIVPCQWIPNGRVILSGIVFRRVVLGSGNDEHLTRMEKSAMDRIDRH